MQRQVAPLVGAWIEMHLLILQRLLVSVAPLVGAWIEIGFRVYGITCAFVAPLVGAWIEIFPIRSSLSNLLSLLL